MSTSWTLRERERERARENETLEIQETVESAEGGEQYKGLAKRWGEDEERAIATLNQLYSRIKKQIMGITAACEVWKPEDPRMHPSSGDLSAEEEMSNRQNTPHRPGVLGPTRILIEGFRIPCKTIR